MQLVESGTGMNGLEGVFYGYEQQGGAILIEVMFRTCDIFAIFGRSDVFVLEF